MSRTDLLERTKRLAIDVFKLVDQLPRTYAGDTIASQLARSGSSQAANYREAKRARSRREFVSKIGISIQEAEETRFWLESIIEVYPDLKGSPETLLDECSQLIAMLTASAKTASRNSPRR